MKEIKNFCIDFSPFCTLITFGILTTEGINRLLLILITLILSGCSTTNTPPPNLSNQSHDTQSDDRDWDINNPVYKETRTLGDQIWQDAE